MYGRRDPPPPVSPTPTSLPASLFFPLPDFLTTWLADFLTSYVPALPFISLYTFIYSLAHLHSFILSCPTSCLTCCIFQSSSTASSLSPAPLTWQIDAMFGLVMQEEGGCAWYGHGQDWGCLKLSRKYWVTWYCNICVIVVSTTKPLK